jgi:hypothetical protein
MDKIDVLGCISGSDIPSRRLKEFSPFIKCLFACSLKHPINRVIVIFSEALLKHGGLLMTQKECLQQLFRESAILLDSKDEEEKRQYNISPEELDDYSKHIKELKGEDSSIGPEDKVIVDCLDCKDDKVLWVTEYLRLFSLTSSQNVALNILSGTVQSKEALQLLGYFYKQISGRKDELKIYYFFDSTPRPSTRPDKIQLFKQTSIQGIDEWSFSPKLSLDRTKRINNSEINKLFFANYMKALLSSYNFFDFYQMYNYVYRNSIKILDSDLLDHIRAFVTMPSLVSKPYNSDSNYLIYNWSDIQKCFKQRLIFADYGLKCKEFGFLPSSLSALNSLLFLLFNIPDKNPPSSLRKESDDPLDKFNKSSGLTKEEEITRLTKRLKTVYADIDISNVDCKDSKKTLLSHFIKLTNQKRHKDYRQLDDEIFLSEDDSDNNNYSDKECYEVGLKVLEVLKQVYARIFNNPNIEKDCYQELVKETIFKLDAFSNKEGKQFLKGITPPLNIKPDNTCILAMSGSTDPYDIKTVGDTNIAFDGSTMHFFKTICHYKGEGTDLFSVLAQCPRLPLFWITSVETYESFRKEGVTIEDIEGMFFKRAQTTLLPFKKDSLEDYINGKRLLLSENPNNYQGPIIYSPEACLSYLRLVFRLLLERYQYIVIIQSSGIPLIKIGMSIMSYLYPERVIPVQIEDPYLEKKNQTSEGKPSSNDKEDEKNQFPKETGDLTNDSEYSRMINEELIRHLLPFYFENGNYFDKSIIKKLLNSFQAVYDDDPLIVQEMKGKMETLLERGKALNNNSLYLNLLDSKVSLKLIDQKLSQDEDNVELLGRKRDIFMKHLTSELEQAISKINYLREKENKNSPIKGLVTQISKYKGQNDRLYFNAKEYKQNYHQEFQNIEQSGKEFLAYCYSKEGLWQKNASVLPIFNNSEKENLLRRNNSMSVFYYCYKDSAIPDIKDKLYIINKAWTICSGEKHDSKTNYKNFYKEEEAEKCIDLLIEFSGGKELIEDLYSKIADLYDFLDRNLIGNSPIKW